MDYVNGLPKIRRHKKRFIVEEICGQLRDHVMKHPESEEWGIIDDYSDTISTRRDENGEIMDDKAYDLFYISLKKRSSRLQTEADVIHGPNTYEYRLRDGVVYGRYIGPRPTGNTPGHKAARRMDTTTHPSAYSLGKANVVDISTRRPISVPTENPDGDETVAAPILEERGSENDTEKIESRPPDTSRRPPGW
jgi:hypothetical protein